MPSPILLEGKVSVCMTTPNKHTSSLDGANVVTLEPRWVVLKKEKFKVYDKKLQITRKKLLQVALTSPLKNSGEVYVENKETKELYFAFPEKVVVLRFSVGDLYSKWSSTCKILFTPDTPPPSPPTSPLSPSPPSPSLSSPSGFPTTMFTTTTSAFITTTTTTNSSISSSSSPSQPGDNMRFGNPTLTASTNWNMKPLPSTPETPPFDLASTDDPVILKREIALLQKRNAHLAAEKEDLMSILGLEKEFVKDRQAKLDSWERFARIIVFKAVCNQSKNEKLRLKLNKLFAKNLPTSKSLKISRMEAIVVNLPTIFDESPNFRLTTYNADDGIATFMFEWFPKNCTCTIQIDGHKYLGGAIPISFKVAIDLLSELRIRGELLVSKGEGNQFLISLPRLPDLTFASPSKLQIGDIFDFSSFALVQKFVESTVFNTLRKHLLQPKWKEVHF